MAVSRETLAELRRQQAALDAILNEQDKRLAKYWMQAWQQSVAELTQMVTAIASSDDPRVSWYTRRRQAAKAVALITDRMRDVLAKHGIELEAAIAELVEAAERDAQRLIATQLPQGMGVAFNRVDQRQTMAILERATQQITARHYHLEAAATDAMKRELARTVPLGVNPNVAAQRMVKAVQGQFNGGVHRARVIARTEQLDAYRAAAEAMHAENSGLLHGWRWIANLTETTCRSCVAMHGSLHHLDEPGPLDHQQGRCARVPVAKTWAELGYHKAPEPPEAVHPGDGERWLATQPARVQDHILGATGGAAWRDGNWPSTSWSTRRATDGWRDSYAPAPQPTVE